MDKEIGSEFWDVPTRADSILQFGNVNWYISGRNALLAIIREIKHIKKIAIPSWICESVIEPFAAEGMDISFYSVYWDHGLKVNTDVDCDAILLMNYFGYTNYDIDFNIGDCVVIRDVTHSVFSNNYFDADYYFGSLRKWCGIWTGGYAYAKDHSMPDIHNSVDVEFVNLRETAMRKKSVYIKNGSDSIDKIYLEIFERAESLLDKTEICPASERDIQIANHLDIDFIKNRRRDNAKILMNSLRDYTIFKELADNDCPLFVPIIVPDSRRDILRQYLIEKKIYCPVHWPVSKYHRLSANERFIYENELSLVCDQRYSSDDMYRIVETISDF